MTEAPFDDNLTSRADCENLWQRVLTVAINEAFTGEGILGSREHRIREITAARRYVTQYNRDFNEVCSLAGLDPDAVRERMAKQLATAPTPEELIERKALKPAKAPKPAKPAKERSARRLTLNGESRSVTEWAERTGIPASAIYSRLALGWPLERILTTPARFHPTRERSTISLHSTEQHQ